jgi:hypothetical protein
MPQLLFSVLRWVLRNVFNLILILAVLFLGKWLHTQWVESKAIEQRSEQFKSERSKIGIELLKASQELEKQLRQSASTNNGAQKLQGTINAAVTTKTAERDKLKRDHPVAVNLPTTPEFKRVAVLEMELSMLEQANTQTRMLTSLVEDVAAGHALIQKLKRQKFNAEKLVYENKLEKWQILSDDSVTVRTAARIPTTYYYKRIRTLDEALPALQDEVKAKQTLIDVQTFVAQRAEGKLDEARRTYLTGHASVDKALSAIDAKYGQPGKDDGKDFKEYLLMACLILLTIILAPIGIKLIFYYVIAPWAARQPSIRISPSTDSQTQSVTMQSTGVSLPIILKNDEEMVLHSDYLQSSDIDSKKAGQLVLNWRYLFTSLAAGMYALTRIHTTNSEPIVVSSSKDAMMELALIDIQDGSAIVFQPHFLVGVIQKRDTPIRIESKWRLWHLHSWLTLQLRYLVFHGPAKLIVSGCRGVRLEPAGKGRLINQAATLGFTTNTLYSVTRCEIFLAYWRGEQGLFNDRFTGEEGSYIYEETPSRNGRSGVTGKGLEGVADAALKVFGI